MSDLPSTASLSTHVLDISVGRPAAGVAVRLERRDGQSWQTLEEGRTDGDGRISGWRVARPGEYRLVFGISEHLGAGAFYPEVTVAFQVAGLDEHYHVPLLLSPFGYSTYRGN